MGVFSVLGQHHTHVWVEAKSSLNLCSSACTMATTYSTKSDDMPPEGWYTGIQVTARSIKYTACITPYTALYRCYTALGLYSAIQHARVTVTPFEGYTARKGIQHV